MLFAIAMLSGMAFAAEKPYDYVFFENSRMDGDYFYSKAEYTSPSWIENSQKKLPVDTDCFSPGNSLRLRFVAAESGDWTASVLYCPIRGNDFFRHPDVLAFNLKYANTDAATLPVVGIQYADSTRSKFVDVAKYVKPFKDGWSRVEIPLNDMGVALVEKNAKTMGASNFFNVSEIEVAEIKKISAVIFKQGAADGKEHTLNIDDVELLPKTGAKSFLQVPEVLECKGYERHIDLRWKGDAQGLRYYKIYRSLNGGEYKAVGIAKPWSDRYTDFIGKVGAKASYKVSAVDYGFNESACSNIVSSSTRPMTDDELLDMVQEANFRYYWEGAEPNSGLARENIPGRSDMIACGASGFGIMTVLVGIDRGFITREQGVERFLKITSFLEKADRFHGAFAHFMDGTTGKVVPFFGKRDNGGDLVETSFLFHGLLAAHQYFNGDSKEEKLIRSRINKLWRECEWNWYKKTKDSKYLFWHWSPDQEWVISHPLIGWNETLITYMISIMSPTHAIEPEMYYTGWASQEKMAQDYRLWGNSQYGLHYTNGNTFFGRKLDVGVSNGGPLFFVHYSFLGLNPHKFSDKYTNYFENSRNIALINHRYCVENQGGFQGYGKDCWGLTASDYAWGYDAREPVPAHDNGTIAPTGALASMPYTPEESLAALKNYYRNYGKFLWGEYGFHDAFNLTQNWVSPIFMGLNQGPVAVMIENYRSQLVWNLFMSHPDVQKGLQKFGKVK